MTAFLTGKKAIVTGGSRGIGYAIAKSLVEAGAAVVICGRRQEDVDNAVSAIGAAGGTISGTTADVGKDDDVERLFKFADEQFGGALDILVNNAGVGLFKPVGEMSIAEWRQTIDTNLTGTFLCCRQALDRFGNSNGGFVVNISSLAGKNPFATGAAYNASKYGVNGFSEALMLDHRHDNVRVSYIMPGTVDTDFQRRVGKPSAEWMTTPEDIADIVMHILAMPARTLISRVEVRPSRPQKR